MYIKKTTCNNTFLVDHLCRENEYLHVYDMYIRKTTRSYNFFGLTIYVKRTNTCTFMYDKLLRFPGKCVLMLVRTVTIVNF